MHIASYGDGGLKTMYILESSKNLVPFELLYLSYFIERGVILIFRD